MAAERIARVSSRSGRVLFVDSFGPIARAVSIHDNPTPGGSGGWTLGTQEARELGEALIRAAEHAGGGS